MTKHPPNRRGLEFEVGAQLEARDRLKNWYTATIEQIDYEEGKVLVHFKRWNHRYDEWFCWDSPYLRPLERIQLRKEGLQDDEAPVGFRVNEQVLACWSDCRFYPAKIMAVNKDGSYTVKFFDGVVQTVKGIHVKALPKEQKSNSSVRSKEKGKERTSSPTKEKSEEPKMVENAREIKANKASKNSTKPEPDSKTVKEEDAGSRRGKEPKGNRRGKEDKENVLENDKHESKVENRTEDKKTEKRETENREVKSPQEKASKNSRKPETENDKREPKVENRTEDKTEKREVKSPQEKASKNSRKPEMDSKTVKEEEAESGRGKEPKENRRGKEDKENVSENDKHESKVENRAENKKTEKREVKSPQEKASRNSRKPEMENDKCKPEVENRTEDKKTEKREVKSTQEKASRNSRKPETENDKREPKVENRTEDKKTETREVKSPQEKVSRNSRKPETENDKCEPKVENRTEDKTTEKREVKSPQEKALKNSRKPETDSKTVKEEEAGSGQDKEPKENRRGKEDKENASENDKCKPKIENRAEDKKTEKKEVKSAQENYTEIKRKSGRPPCSPPTGILELRKRKIIIGAEPVQLKRPRHEKNPAPEKIVTATESSDRDQSKRRSSRLSSSGHQDTKDPVPENSVPSHIQPPVIVNSDCKEPEKVLEVELESPEPSERAPTEQTEQSSDNTSDAVTLEHKDVDNDLQQKPEEEITIQTEPSTAPSEAKETSAETAPVLKRMPRSQNPNKYSREPLNSTIKRSEDPLSSKTLAIDLDHNNFKCKFSDCSKSFRKAKLLHYHMKYYHGVEKPPESEQGPAKRVIQTRGSSASGKVASPESPKRRRTTSGSSCKCDAPLHTAQRNLPASPTDHKAVKLCEKRRTSVPPSGNNITTQRLSLREKSKENQFDKSHRKQHEKDKERDSSTETVIKDKDKDKNRERKFKDFLRIKLKKKKKKKKKSKSEHSGGEENIDISRDFSPKKTTFIPARLSSSHKVPYSQKNLTLCNSDPGYPQEKIKHEEEDTLSDSSTDSLFWSDDDYNQDIDVTTNPDEIPDGEESDFEIVRCICEVQEENDFMIQCEECLCWQHGVCMGLLEDNVPEKYTCYICREPPGQRSSLKYWYDREWLNHGHMHGLAFLEENYSHQNARKIVATHQLLGDVQRVMEVLHGLQLKMNILQNRDHPDLKLWCQPWNLNSTEEKLQNQHSNPVEGNSRKENSTSCRTLNGVAERPLRVPSIEESYITSEHCYQKPRAYYPAVEQRLVVETRGSSMDDGVNRIRENGDDALTERSGWELERELSKSECESKQSHFKASEALLKKAPSEEDIEVKLEEDSEGVESPQLQWQLNLLTHVESVQDEVTHRMDVIEKELDVLESWLDYTGELEPPEPLARLPQLKHHIKQLLTDLGRVQQIALCCAT